MSSMENFLFLCRLCGTETTADTRINIFDSTGILLDINIKLTKCIGIYVRETDYLPKVLCHECLNQLEYVYNFRNNCYGTWKKLQDLYEKQFNSIVEEEKEEVETKKSSVIANAESKPTTGNDDQSSYEVQKEVTEEMNNPKVPLSRSRSRYHKVRTGSNYEMFQCKECKCVMYFKETAVQHLFTEHNIDVEDKSNKPNVNIDKERSDNKKIRTGYFNHLVFRIQLGKQPSSSILTLEQPFICNTCSRAFHDKATLKNHMKTHNENRSVYPCNLCEKSFLSSNYLKRHKLSHQFTLDERRKFKCTKCDASFTTKDASLYHMDSMHSKVPKVECKICFKQFKNEKNLRMHSIIHSDNKKVCDVCGKVCQNNYMLKNHYILHTNIRPYSCSNCQKKYAKKSSLKFHIKKRCLKKQ